MAKTDPKELLKAIEAEEAQAFADFEQKVKDQRVKKLAGIIDPLKKERGDLAAQRNECDIKIAELDKQISALTGVKQKQSGGGKRRQRKSKDEKASIAFMLVRNMTKGKEYSAGDLENGAEGLPVKQLIQLWNDANKDKKVTITGKKSTTRYVKE